MVHTRSMERAFQQQWTDASHQFQVMEPEPNQHEADCILGRTSIHVSNCDFCRRRRWLAQLSDPRMRRMVRVGRSWVIAVAVMNTRSPFGDDVNEAS